MDFFNEILERKNIENQIKHILSNFDSLNENTLFKRGIYIYGSSGCGKTYFIEKILKDMNYDIIKYDAGDIRNKNLIESINSNSISNYNVLQMMNGIKKKIAIIMDEIDGMNNGDKGGINTLIKLIRPKKTKKQKLEEITMNPIICIGNYRVDKKIKELMKVCNTIELKPPTNVQMNEIIQHLFTNADTLIKNKIVDFIQNDLRKLKSIYTIYKNNPEFLKNEIIEDIFQIKSYNDDTKKITNKLINNYYNIDEHIHIMNETDRTSVGLLWHENIIDVIDKYDKKQSIPFYISQLDNICFADYIDRITFQ